MPLALFGLDGGVGLFVNLLIIFLVVVYLALIWWTYLDARRRIEDPVLIACATAASVFPFLGTVVYRSCARRSSWRIARSASWS